MSISHLPVRRSTSAFIVDENDRVLIVQLIGYNENEWGLPGGGVDEGETPYQAVCREINEELGIASAQLQLLGESPHINTYDFEEELRLRSGFRGQEKRQFIFTPLTNLKIVPQAAEIRRAQWVALDDLDTYLIFPGQIENARLVLADLERMKQVDGTL